MSLVFFGLFGLVVGSFLNVLILRHGKEPLTGRSRCPHCGSHIAWYDNIPLISWMLLRARCRGCRAPISVQYPLVEALTGALFAAVGGAFVLQALFDWHVWPRIFADLGIVSLLIAILVYDLRHMLIPDRWAYAFAALALLSAVSYQPSAESLFAGPVTALPLFALWYISRGRWMGFGDVKLALGIGWLLGPWWGLFAVFLAFIIGGTVSAPLLLLSSPIWRTFLAFTPSIASKKLMWGFTMKSEIPFGPFLICSTLIVWFAQLYGIDIFTLLFSV